MPVAAAPCPPAPSSRSDVPRRPERTALHLVVREHLESFLATVREQRGKDIPHYVEEGVRAAGLDPEHLDSAAEATARQRDASRSSLRTDERRSAVLKAFLPLATGEIGVTARRGRIVISMPSQLLFKAGRDALATPGEKTLRDIAALIRGDKLLKSLTYQIVGHTASGAPTAPWRNSWDLTLAQARAVLFFLVQEQGGGLPVAHWSVAGFADMDPVEPGGGPTSGKRGGSSRCSRHRSSTTDRRRSRRRCRSSTSTGRTPRSSPAVRA